ncbi:MAG: hypothetical protein NTU79_22480 [Planctomycetota bacterium]|nr:hypothetical protein [Planctomycetota bacterium]
MQSNRSWVHGYRHKNMEVRQLEARRLLPDGDALIQHTFRLPIYSIATLSNLVVEMCGILVISFTVGVIMLEVPTSFVLTARQCLLVSTPIVKS